MPDILWNVLQAWRKETVKADDDDFIFASSRNGGAKPFTPCSCKGSSASRCHPSGSGPKKDGKLYDRRGEQLRRFGCHNFRHSLSSFLSNEGNTTPETIRDIMRHKKVEMTAHYIHTQEAMRLAAVESMAKRLAGEVIQ